MADLSERTGVVTFKGNHMTLVGPELSVGHAAPDAGLTSTALAPILPISAASGKAILFVIIPSVDTSVCSLESKRFSEEVRMLPADLPITVYGVSADLPFALRRWCGAEGVDNLIMLSDYRGLRFGHAWGLAIKELHLLARAVYVIDKEGKVVYREIVPEVSSEPNYEAAMAALKAAASQ